MKIITLITIIPIIVLFFLNCSKESEIVSDLNSDTPVFDNGVIALSEEDKAILEKDNLSNNDDNILLKDNSIIRLAHEIRLKYFAKALAVSLCNDEMVNIIMSEVMEKFDGDTEVLWEMVSSKLLSNGMTFREFIDTKFIKDSCSLISIDEIEKTPLLNILFVPSRDGGFDDKPTKVIYLPISKNDIEVDTVFAYDTALNEYHLSAKEVPDFSVFVVGINERVNPINKTVKYNGLNKQTKVTADYTDGYIMIRNHGPREQRKFFSR